MTLALEVYEPANQRTRNQMSVVILIDCLEKCNALNLPQKKYEQALHDMLLDRLDIDSAGIKKIVQAIVSL